jgi:hypothetical protein
MLESVMTSQIFSLALTTIIQAAEPPVPPLSDRKKPVVTTATESLQLPASATYLRLPPVTKQRPP